MVAENIKVGVSRHRVARPGEHVLKFWMVDPGVVLPPHHGVSNIKLTVHLPVELPGAGCSITVGGETRQWREDDFLIFDDAFLHSAENRTDQGPAAQPRTVLIFDVWHPRLHPAERQALAQAVQAIDAVMAVAGDWF